MSTSKTPGIAERIEHIKISNQVAQASDTPGAKVESKGDRRYITLQNVDNPWMVNILRIDAAICLSAFEGKSVPSWVVRASERVWAMAAPVAAKAGRSKKGNPFYEKGASLGHIYAAKAAYLELLYKNAFPNMSPVEREVRSSGIIRRGELAEIMEHTEFATGIGLNDATMFWRGFADALQVGAFRIENGMPVRETLRLNTLLTMIENWPEIEKGKASIPKWRLEDLQVFLKKFLGSESGDLKRLSKLCQNLGLKVLPRGRPRNSS